MAGQNNAEYIIRELTINNLIKKCESLENTVVEVLNGTGNEIGRYNSYKIFAQTYNSIIEEAIKEKLFYGSYNTFNLSEIPSEFNTTWPMQKSVMESVLVNIRMLKVLLNTDSDFKKHETDNIENFIYSNLRPCFDKEPKSEAEVQKAIETLFIGKGMKKGIDYDKETGKFRYSSKEYTPDFIIQNLNMCIEVKFINSKKTVGSFIDQINADIPAYSTKYQNILFVIYDVGMIVNETEFRRDIENNKLSNIKVIIVKH